MVELLHIFMNKLIFNEACYVRFIVPMTKAQLENSRGQEVIYQLEVIQNMINSDVRDIGRSIAPIITKCEPGDDKIDMDMTRYTLDQQIENHISQLEKQANYNLF